MKINATNMIKKGETVVLKPNAGHAAPPESAVCTNPETLRAVFVKLKKLSHIVLLLLNLLQSDVIQWSVLKFPVWQR